MPTKKVSRRIPRVVAAASVGTRLSRMEDLLIEMRSEQDVKLRKLNKLQRQIDDLTEVMAELSRRFPPLVDPQ